MERIFGELPQGGTARLYTISCGGLRAEVTDLGATLVSLWVPDRQGNAEDVVLGYDHPADYVLRDGCLGATVGRNANRIGGARFTLEGITYLLGRNDGNNNLHSGPNAYYTRLWQVEEATGREVTFSLESCDGDQGFPGNARITVTYTLDQNALTIRCRGIADQTTVFNLTNHSYFNLAGHQHPERAMEQKLTLWADAFTPADGAGIPTGEIRSVEDTPMDFRREKALGQDLGAQYDALELQHGYDHNYVLSRKAGAPAARLREERSGRTMTVYTDCPGLQVYTANFLEEGCPGKGGARYGPRSAVCLETQFFPDCLHKPQWPSSVVRAGERYETVTRFCFGE